MGIEPRPARADATQDLYERYARQVMGFCVNQLGSRDEAEDAVQSTFLNAHRALQRGVTPDAELAWLFKIAHNVCLTRRRSTRRRGRVEAASDLQSMQDVIPAPSHDNADELIRLTDALAHMPDNQRRAILLREWQGLSYHEIADELGLSQSAVETLIFRARRSLAANLEAAEPEANGLVARARAAIDIGSLLMAAKALLGGGAAMKAAATAVAVSGAAVIATAPMKPAPSAAKQGGTATPVAVVEHSAPVAASDARESQLSAPRLERPTPAAAHASAGKNPAGADADASASVAASTSEPQASAPASDPVQLPTAAPKDHPRDKANAKRDKASGPPAQVTPIERPKAKPPHAGGNGHGNGKAGKQAEPLPPAAITPVGPVETIPAPAPEGDGKKDKHDGGTGQNQ